MIAQGLNALKQALVGSGATKPSTAHEAQPGTDGDQDEDFDLEEVDHMETEEPERDQALTKTPAAEGKKGRGKKAGPSKGSKSASKTKPGPTTPGPAPVQDVPMTSPLPAAAAGPAPAPAPSLAPLHPVQLAAPLTDAHHAIDYLTARMQGPCRPLTASSSSNAAAAAAASAPLRTMALRPALQRAHDELVDLLGATVRDAASISVLILGDHGTGKTLLVERAIATLCAAHNGAPPAATAAAASAAGTSAAGAAAAAEASAAAAGQAAAAAAGALEDKVVGVVRLSGLLHCDERVAFQEVARQLCSEFRQLFSSRASYDENLVFLRAMLAGLHKACKAVVFVLDDFEKFAKSGGNGTSRSSRQTLLYNLLDVLQHSKVQAAVLGLTCAQDVMESLEKRVRSRFSHRKIVLTAPSHLEVPAAAGSAAGAAAAGGAAARRPGAPRGGLDDEAQAPITYEDTPAGILKAMLSLPAAGEQGLGVSGAGSSGARGGGARAGAVPGAPQAGWQPGYVTAHNTAVATALKDTGVKAELKRLFAWPLTPAMLTGVARTALERWDAELYGQQQDAAGADKGPVGLAARHLLEGIRSALEEDRTSQLVAECSQLQLFLLAAMVRLEQRNLQVFNFEMVWDECRSLPGLRFRQRAAAWRAFEGLVAGGLAFWVDQGAEAKGRPLAYAGVSLRLTPTEVDQGLSAHPSCPEELKGP